MRRRRLLDSSVWSGWRVTPAYSSYWTIILAVYRCMFGSAAAVVRAGPITGNVAGDPPSNMLAWLVVRLSRGGASLSIEQQRVELVDLNLINWPDNGAGVVCVVAPGQCINGVPVN